MRWRTRWRSWSMSRDRPELEGRGRALRAWSRLRFAEQPRIDDVLPGEAKVNAAAFESLAGRRRGLAALWPFLGPAFMASVAYVDPGNFATNVAGGARF